MSVYSDYESLIKDLRVILGKLDEEYDKAVILDIIDLLRMMMSVEMYMDNRGSLQ